MSHAEQSEFTGTRKAAILLSLLGEDAAAPILRNLPDDDVERITEEVTNLGHVPLEVTLLVLEEYHQMMTAQEFIAVGGQDVAVRLLVKAFGENGAKDMVDRLARQDEDRSFRPDAFRKADPQQLARFLAGEHSQTRALILSHLDGKQAAALLMKLEPEVRADCVRRLANLGQFSPEVAAKVSTVLNRRLRSVGDQSRRANTGFRNIAELMNRLDPLTAREILETIDRDEPKLAINIRDLMFTFDNFLEVPEHEMRELMNTIDKKTLMVALKGASEDLKSHFYRTMSSRAVEMMKEDSEVMGPVRSKDVAKAQAEIVAIARKLEAEGKIVLKSEGEDEYVLECGVQRSAGRAVCRAAVSGYRRAWAGGAGSRRWRRAGEEGTRTAGLGSRDHRGGVCRADCERASRSDGTGGAEAEPGAGAKGGCGAVGDRPDDPRV